MRLPSMCNSHTSAAEVHACAAQYLCWVELLLAQIMTPNASLLGHVSGILAGLLHVYVLERAVPGGRNQSSAGWLRRRLRALRNWRWRRFRAVSHSCSTHLDAHPHAPHNAFKHGSCTAISHAGGGCSMTSAYLRVIVIMGTRRTQATQRIDALLKAPVDSCWMVLASNQPQAAHPRCHRRHSDFSVSSTSRCAGFVVQLRSCCDTSTERTPSLFIYVPTVHLYQYDCCAMVNDFSIHNLGKHQLELWLPHGSEATGDDADATGTSAAHPVLASRQ